MLTFARVRALAIIAVLVLGALIAVLVALTRDDGLVTADHTSCPDDGVVANLELADPREIRINVYNATDQSGLASQVGEAFANRDFEVVEQGEDPRDTDGAGVAVLRYGPQAVGAAHVLQAYFLNTATFEFDLEREDDVVDVVLGNGYRQLATPTEVRLSIAALGSPVPPPGTCVAT
ncbi:LytR C-terminal domain-containing protein [Natronosporangium hydrolyticum]|uniref:LytR C-terminal domain-containing protein n=2 Tax=Natronosporangium hydrolyticum TaxID=2811111 RepID=A0A895YTG0_9ACTN|nr:LytR C-terminal domain-containing protein [Natronosporangium hydrolyticum]